METIHGRILVGKLAAPIDPVVEKVDARPHAVGIGSLTNVNLRLQLPRLTVALLRVEIIQILGPVGLFLTTWGSLPLLKLLENLAIGVVDWHNRLAITLTHECLKLVFDLRLLLFQVVGMKNGSGLGLLLQFDLLVRYALRHGRTDCSRFELVLQDLLVN